MKRQATSKKRAEKTPAAAPAVRRPGVEIGLSFSLIALLTAQLSLPALALSSGSSGEDSGASKPSGTLLLPLTPKIDTTADAPVDDDEEETSSSDAAAGSKPESSISGIKTVAPQVEEPKLDKNAPAPAQGQETLSTEIDLEEANAANDNIDTSQYDATIGEDTTLHGTIQIVADDTEYDQDKNTFLGSGNAVAIIGGQNARLEADMILYDQNSDMIDARGNVKIIRDGQVTTGKSFKFKVNSDEYLITDPDTEIQGTTVIARRGMGTKDGLMFKEGNLTMPDPIYMQRNAMFGPVGYTSEMMRKAQHPDAYLPAKPGFKFKARRMVYEKYKEQGNFTIFGGKLMFGKFGVPLPKFTATISKQENNVVFPVTPFVGNNLQVGGVHVGPSFNYSLGKLGTMSWAPMLQFGGRSLNGSTSGGSGVGLSGRASIHTRKLIANIGAGSVNHLMVADLHYKIRKQFRFQSGINKYLDDGMFGFRRARATAEFVDNHMVPGVPFLSSLNFRSSAGFFQDNPQLINLNPQYAKLFGGDTTSTVMNKAFKLQEQITATTHPLFAVGDDKWGVKSFIYGGLALRGYSSGDAGAIAQAGPVLDVRLNKARMNFNYTQSGVRGSTPFVFDQFIQGQRSVNMSGDFKINRYLTLGGGLGYNLNNKLFYSKTVTAAIGPDDFKVLVTRDMIRGINRIGFDVLYGSPINFKTLSLKGAPDYGNLGGGGI